MGVRLLCLRIGLSAMAAAIQSIAGWLTVDIFHLLVVAIL
jgi:hypothetical protein